MTALEERPNYLGTTPPVSLSFPTSDELKSNRDLEQYLSFRGDVYESEDGERNRCRVIDKLGSIIVEWAADVGRKKNIVESVYADGGGICLKIFGSTRLGVHTPDADIDVLCIAPSFVDRGDFFTSFCSMMKERADVSMLAAVPDAYTPVVKFNIDNQAIDMIFASLAIESIPKDLDVLDSSLLRGLDEQGIRSLNGSRVAEWICRLVPDFQTFCLTLRFIKHWARQRGLYSNVLGFLGGVNYAILVAFVCQRYPNACPATLVRKFFVLYTQWQWPSPIMLTRILDRDPADTDGRHLSVWNPRVYPKDGAHVMPIITPAYPSMNSSYNVGVPQYRLIIDEIIRGQKIFQDHRNTDAPFPWQALCAPAVTDFFMRHPRYIQIDITAMDADEHRSWFGWVESRLRILILALEQPPLVFCHPQANCFHRRIPILGTNNLGSIPFSVSMAMSRSASSGQLRENNKRPASDSETSEGEGTSTSVSAGGDGGSVQSPGRSSGAAVSNNADSDEATAASGEKSVDDPLLSGESKGIPPIVQSNQASERSASISFAEGEEAPTKTAYVSSFFIGLSFRNGLRTADVTFPVQDFIYRVNTWDRKKPSMEIVVKACKQEDIPDFVYETKAEPSSMKSCTPAKTHRNITEDEQEIECGRRLGKRLEDKLDDAATDRSMDVSERNIGGGGSDGPESNDDGVVCDTEAEDKCADSFYAGPAAQFASQFTGSLDSGEPIPRSPEADRSKPLPAMRHRGNNEALDDETRPSPVNLDNPPFPGGPGPEQDMSFAIAQQKDGMPLPNVGFPGGPPVGGMYGLPMMGYPMAAGFPQPMQGHMPMPMPMQFPMMHPFVGFPPHPHPGLDPNQPQPHEGFPHPSIPGPNRPDVAAPAQLPRNANMNAGMGNQGNARRGERERGGSHSTGSRYASQESSSVASSSDRAAGGSGAEPSSPSATSYRTRDRSVSVDSVGSKEERSSNVGSDVAPSVGDSSADAAESPDSASPILADAIQSVAVLGTGTGVGASDRGQTNRNGGNHQGGRNFNRGNQNNMQGQHLRMQRTSQAGHHQQQHHHHHQQQQQQQQGALAGGAHRLPHHIQTHQQHQLQQLQQLQQHQYSQHQQLQLRQYQQQLGQLQLGQLQQGQLQQGQLQQGQLQQGQLQQGQLQQGQLQQGQLQPGQQQQQQPLQQQQPRQNQNNRQLYQKYPRQQQGQGHGQGQGQGQGPHGTRMQPRGEGHSPDMPPHPHTQRNQNQNYQNRNQNQNQNQNNQNRVHQGGEYHAQGQLQGQAARGQRAFSNNAPSAGGFPSSSSSSYSSAASGKKPGSPQKRPRKESHAESGGVDDSNTVKSSKNTEPTASSSSTGTGADAGADRAAASGLDNSNSGNSGSGSSSSGGANNDSNP